MPPPLPRCSGWAYSSLISPNRVSLPRKGRRVGLHIDIFEACSAFTHVAACTLALSPIRDTLIEGFSHFVTSMTAPIAFRLERIAGWDLHPLESAALSRRTPNPAIARARLRKRLAEDLPIAAGRFNPARHASRTSLDARGLIVRRPTDA